MVRRFPWRFGLIAVVLICWAAAEALHLGNLSHSKAYPVVTSLLLAIGLYASTYGIDLREAKEHRRVILLAVTVGVVLKAALIGGALYLATRDPLYLLLGVAVAQIDPLSVAALMGENRLSPKARTILSAWASFDDPLTVILTVYAVALVSPGGGVFSGLSGYGVSLVANLAFAAVAILVWRLLRNRPGLLAPILVVLAAVAVWQFLMLGVAIAGLVVRPAWLSRYLERVTFAALFVAAGLLGLLLVLGIDPVAGLMLGAAAFGAQVVVGLLMTRGLGRADRIHLALAQQNGITAIILGLRLEGDFDRAIAVIAPAILVTNALHFAANYVADRRAVTSPA
jgi:Sodium/hydrogen exchanger family